MKYLQVYDMGLGISGALFVLCCILPLHYGGEYEPGFTAFALLIYTAPLIASDTMSLVHSISYVLAFLVYITVLVSLRGRLFRRGWRLCVFVLFLLLVVTAIAANSRTHAFPAGPSALVLLLSVASAVVAYGWSLYDRGWR